MVFSLASAILRLRLLYRLLLDNVEHLTLDGLLLEDEAVLVPDEVGSPGVDVVLLHATLEQPDDVSVVWILSEAQTSAVVHELFEFFWLVATEIFNGRFLLLFLDIGILFGLRPTRESLPRQRALQEVEDDMTNGFEVIPSGLLVPQMGVERGVTCSTSQVLTVTEWDVLAV